VSIQIRHRNERGEANLGWLNSWHTFSFADYYDPRFMGFRALRVINDDRIQPGTGFGTHPHQDMEIITYVLEGAVEHKDSMGNGSIIRPGEAQRMSAGTGIRHSEYNASKTEILHLLQIWILPEVRGIPPGYEQKTLNRDEMRGKLRLIAAKAPDPGAVKIHQDLRLFATILDGETVKYDLDPRRYAWIQIARGKIQVNGTALEEGDGVAMAEESSIQLDGNGEALLFDLS
jgi:quercetin 2,3-dioxygenase